MNRLPRLPDTFICAGCGATADYFSGAACTECARQFCDTCSESLRTDPADPENLFNVHICPECWAAEEAKEADQDAR